MWWCERELRKEGAGGKGKGVGQTYLSPVVTSRFFFSLFTVYRKSLIRHEYVTCIILMLRFTLGSSLNIADLFFLHVSIFVISTQIK